MTVTVKEPKLCERPGCGIRFVPARKDQKYCSSTCKRRFHAYRHVLNRGR